MSHVITVDFQAHRVVYQEVTLDNLIPTLNGIATRYAGYDRLKRERDAARHGKHGEDGYVNTACPCADCRDFFAAHTLKRKRSTSEIWADLHPLRMTGDEDEPKRRALIAELRAAQEPLDWGTDPKGAA